MRNLLIILGTIGILSPNSLASAQLSVAWPEIQGEISNYKQCDELDGAYLKLRAMLEQRHSQCISQTNARAEGMGATCSNSSCQGLHNLLFSQLETRRAAAVNSCRSQVRLANQQCIGRIAVEQASVAKRQSQLDDSYRSNCIGVNPSSDMGRACTNLRNEIVKTESYASSLIDKRQNDCR